MLALLAATGVIILAQVASTRDLIGVLLVMLGVAIHKPLVPEPPAQGVDTL